MKTSLLGIVLAAMLAAPAMVAAQDAAKQPPAGDAAPTQNPAAGTTPASDDNVRITVLTVPARRALVRWGKKKLGTIPVPKPLVVVRPRDSGPMDLVIRVPGYLPVHTRAYTFSDHRLAVRLTPVTEKHRLFGYREELPPEEDAAAAPDPNAPTPAPDQPVPAPPQPTTAP